MPATSSPGEEQAGNDNNWTDVILMMTHRNFLVSLKEKSTCVFYFARIFSNAPIASGGGMGVSGSPPPEHL